ncbi:hypothetical protein [Kribbella sp. NPDC049227]|uniref:hypothetical protein n=1 Tax=Kribbella sp. NPDC049227 TaxID=3364113 RepID=UPI0037128FE2
MSIIAGLSQTGKTSVIDFISYCLGGKQHPQHPEIVEAVRAALVEFELNGQATTVERSAIGAASKFASVWQAGMAELATASELRIPAEPVGDPDGLSQFVLAACDLSGIELPEAPTQSDSATDLLSIRDLFRVMFVPNERLDNKNLVFEQSNFMVRQKFSQTIDVMFGVLDVEGAGIGARYRAARDAARAAAQTAVSLRRLADSDYPRGPLLLAQDSERARAELAELQRQLVRIDQERRSTDTASRSLRVALQEAQDRSSQAAVRVRDRRSLLARLGALRGQYADDQRKLNFLRDAERLFDPLQVVACPVCLNDLDTPPSVEQGICSMCGHHADGNASSVNGASGESAVEAPEGVAVLEAELRAVSKRLTSLNAYYERLDAHLRVLVDESIAADEAALEAAAAVDAVTDSPAPWLALRDDITRRIAEARLAMQAADAGRSLWQRVDDAESNRDRLEEEARRINSQRRELKARPDRGAIVSALSGRFGEILSDIRYPKLSGPFLDNNLVPHVRGLSYTDASSGGRVLISLAWHLALWEIAHERDAAAPGLLVIDSPQKNLGHGAVAGDPEFADSALVENFYNHARTWLRGDGLGAQLIVVDNSPPDSVSGDIVVRYTRDPDVEPYGLITTATS